jgi:hypothetical protein
MPFDGFGFTHLLWRSAEVRLEGAGEGFVTCVTAVQRDAQNVVCAGA